MAFEREIPVAGVLESSFDFIIDARSPREYAEDHLPGAINLPVVDDEEFAVVGTQHRTDTHRAYLIGVAASLRRIADHLDTAVSHWPRNASILIYCFRGGKRSKLWADTLTTVASSNTFKVHRLVGGWKAYRQHVVGALDTVFSQFQFNVLSGPTGCGKTRLLHALERNGEQVLDLEGMARHRGSVLGVLPGIVQPTQKQFDSELYARVRHFDTSRPIWVEAESKRIGRIHLPSGLMGCMRQGQVIPVDAPMSGRVQLWIEDYPHWAADLRGFMARLEFLRPLVGSERIAQWQDLADAGAAPLLFERVMLDHYDPTYTRSLLRNYPDLVGKNPLRFDPSSAESLELAVRALLAHQVK